MKHILLLSAAVVCVLASTTAQATCPTKSASGTTFTVGLGYKGLQGNQRVYTATRASYYSNFKDQFKISAGTAAGVVSLGYGQQGLFAPHFYLGAEVKGDFGQAQSKVMTVGPVTGSGLAGYLTSFENRYSWGGALRAGVVHNGTLWFVSVGGGSGNFRFRYIDVTNWRHTLNSFKKNLGSVTWGFGAETHFKKVLLKAELGFAHYKKLSLKNLVTTPGAVDGHVWAKMTPRTSTASVSVGYRW